MFDWNDEEISSILWGEAIESDDHIVPYPEASDNCRDRKEWNLEFSTYKSTEQKSVAHKIDIRGEKRGTILNFNANQEAAHIANDSENFQHLDGDKEQNNFVDYGWDNIGGFDDLDQIFSANNQLFGNGSHDHWPSSQDGTSSLLKSFPISVGSPSSGLGALTKASNEFDVKNDYVEQYYKLGCGKPASQGPEKLDISLKGKPSAINSKFHPDSVLAENGTADKVSRKRRLIKSRKRLVEKNNGNSSQDFYCDGSSSGNQFVSPIIQSPSLSVLSQQRQLVGPLDSQEYQHNSVPFVGPTYGNVANSFSVTPVVSGVPSEEPKHQLLLSGYEIFPVNANLANNSEDAPVKSLTMTPKEKIEKLRRRQQMQAMLAIQKQQQQLDNQATSIDDAINQNCDQENEIQHVDGANYVVDHPSTVSLFDEKSTLQQDGSGTTSFAINGSTMEDTIFFRLEEIVAKLDTRIRLCIRDSLFRLAQSATQRHHATVTNGCNDSVGVEEEVANEDMNNSKKRDTRMSDAETKTNPIDRTIAHLLFHRHVGLNVQYPDKPESPVCVKLQ